MPHLVSAHCIEPHFLRNVLDVLVIGTGTAGLSAAMTLGLARRSAIVYDVDDHGSRLHETTSQMISKSIQDETIAEIKTKFKTIMFSRATAASVREKGMVFEVEDVSGRRWKGRKVILAMMSRDIRPDIPGYEEAWGKKMSFRRQAYVGFSQLVTVPVFSERRVLGPVLDGWLGLVQTCKLPRMIWVCSLQLFRIEDEA
ncbi:thioredoxin reductase [Fusarium circinatum]|uniref:Thioredoxin reductase n=1 Tax=Fusarium circinatum TaxID=48490 RepID=A0A8H5X393_FUSCI|nr:thioredoxin reductase [Fusarium circinatum]